MSLLRDLAAVRDSRGLPPLPDPTRIQGFGEPGDAPSPGLPPAIELEGLPGHDRDAGDEFGVHDDPPTREAPPPLPATLAPTRRAPLPDEPSRAEATPSGVLALELTLQKALASAAATLPQAKLALIDKLGEWKGRKVVLTDDEYADVLEVIFRAQRRELDADQAEILGRVTRRRRVTVKAEGPKPDVPPGPGAIVADRPASGASADTIRRRRNRKRGSLLNRTP